MPTELEPAALVRQALPAWIAFGTLLVLEYLSLSFLFDAQDILKPAGLAAPLKEAGSAVPLLFIVAIATLVTGGRTLVKALDTLSVYQHTRAGLALRALLHLGTFVAVVLLGLAIANQRTVGLSWQPAVALWMLLVLANFATCAWCFWRPATVPAALNSMRSGLIIGLAVGILAWCAALGARFLWEPLTWLTLELVHGVITLIAHDPVASVTHKLVGTERFYVTIAPVCSGVEGLGLMLAFMSAFLYLKRTELRWPRAFLLLPLTLIAIWLLNVVRISALIGIGTWWSEDIALGGFHSKAGWVLFTLAALAAVRFAQASPQFSTTIRAGTPSIRPRASSSLKPLNRGSRPDVAFLLPLLAVLSVSLLSGLVTSDFDHLYPLRVVVGATLLIKYRAHYPSLRITSLWPGLITGLALAALWILAFQSPAEPATNSLGDELESLPYAWAGAWLLFRIIGTTLTVPLIEELAFRGYLMRRIQSPQFEKLTFQAVGWLPLIASSLAFGALHSQWILGLVAGLVFGAIVILRGKFGEAVLAHSVANSALVVYVLVSRNWAILG